MGVKHSHGTARNGYQWTVVNVWSRRCAGGTIAGQAAEILRRHAGNSMVYTPWTEGYDLTSKLRRQIDGRGL